ncbi:MAG: hypothetical protein VW268_00295 [Rhodospirillaceae bacterium]
MGAERQTTSNLDMYSNPPKAPARHLVPLSPAITSLPDGAIDVPAKPEKRNTPFSRMTGGLSLRSITPRQMAEISLELYAARVLTYEDYELLAFQPELHPLYNATIGALTGEPAAPDRARDYVTLWEDRLNFEQRHYPRNTRQVQKTERIVRLLHRLDAAKNGRKSKSALVA